MFWLEEQSTSKRLLQFCNVQQKQKPYIEATSQATQVTCQLPGIQLLLRYAIKGLRELAVAQVQHTKKLAMELEQARGMADSARMGWWKQGMQSGFWGGFQRHREPSAHNQYANGYSRHAHVTISYLESAIEAGKDLERDVNGTGSKEALNGYF